MAPAQDTPLLSEAQRTKFWSKVEKTIECWLWQGTLSNGRAIFHVGRPHRPPTVFAARLSWVMANGAIPVGLSVCHHCDNPACVRPDHLFLGTQHDNMRDAVRKGRVQGGHGHETHCPKGHPYTGRNLRLRYTPDGRMYRCCRACQAAHEQRRTRNRPPNLAAYWANKQITPCEERHTALRAALASLEQEMRAEMRRISRDFDIHTVPSLTVFQWADRIAMLLKESPCA